jgi:hypothetical protein
MTESRPIHGIVGFVAGLAPNLGALPLDLTENGV